MKPIKLILEGIRSYTAPQEIDFERLSAYGVFGITGSTGSGKSSVIDAIIIALYGYDKKDKSKHRGFVNLSSELAFISFTFESQTTDGRRRYRIERTYPSLKSHSGKAALYDLTSDGECIASNPTECDSLIQSIIGLGKQEFVNCVILEQNKYSGFLTADPKDRKDIIGKIFSLEKYGEPLVIEVRKRIKEFEGKIFANNEIINSKGAVSKQAVKDNEQAQSDNLNLLNEKSAAHNRLLAEQKTAETIRTAAAAATDLDSQINKAEIDLVAAAASRTAAGDKLNHAKTAYEQAEKALNLTIFESKNNLDKLKEIISSDLPLSSRAEQEYASAVAKYKSADAGQQSLKALQASSESDYTKLNDTISLNLNSLNNLCGTAIPNDDTLDSRLSGHRIIYVQYLDCWSNIFTHGKTLSQSTAKHQELTDKIKLLSAEQNRLELLISSKRKALNTAMRTNAVGFVRHSTKDGEPCPVCGGIYHESTVDGVNMTDDSALAAMEQDINRTEELFKSVSADLAHYNNLISAEIEKGNNAKASLISLQETVDGQEFSAFVCPASPDDIVSRRKLFTQYMTVLSQDATKIKTLRTEIDKRAATISTNAAVIEGLIKEGKAAKEALNSVHERINRLLNGADPDKEVTRLNMSLSTAEKELNRLTDNIKSAEINYNVAHTAAEKIQSALETLRQSRAKIIISSPPLSDEAYIALTNQVAGLDDFIKTLHAADGRLKAEHTALTQALAEIIKLQADNDIHEKILKTHKELEALVAAGRFMEYICNEYISRFTAGASELLLSLTSGQFALKYYDTAAMSGFYIVDYLNGGLERKATTASGGETFLVSLSLAVSISRTLALRSNAASVEFLFIDEGFGTLDSELIDTVMDALEKLKSQTFTIGLISHRAEIQQRLPLKIIVEKTPNGSVILT